MQKKTRILTNYLSWNIAIDFDMSFSPKEIATMLDDYSKYNNVTMDMDAISEKLCLEFIKGPIQFTLLKCSGLGLYYRESKIVY